MNIYHNPELKQINILDERFYSVEGTDLYFPSVTTVLEVYTKGYGFQEWLKSVGMNADLIVERAAREGSNIHNAIESFLRGQSVTWFDQFSKPQYNLTEWTCICKFMDFYYGWLPEVIAIEKKMISNKHRLGLTIDLVCKLNGLRYLIDYKSSNALHKTQELQLAAYATVWNHHHPEMPIDRTAILHLKADTRGADKQGKKIQGKGWQLKEFDRHYSEAYKIFQAARVIWDEENPNYRPKNLIYPDRFSLNSEKQTETVDENLAAVQSLLPTELDELNVSVTGDSLGITSFDRIIDNGASISSTGEPERKTGRSAKG